MFEQDFKVIVTENAKTRHLSLRDLHKRVTAIKSYQTFAKKLENPQTFTIEEVNQICEVLRLTPEERQIVKGETKLDEIIQRLAQ